MLKYGRILFVGLLLAGCSSKKSEKLLEVYLENNHRYKMLQKTEKLQFKEDNETKLLLTATYLNRTKLINDDNSDEIFLIGIYSEKKRVKSLTAKDFNITLRNIMTKEENLSYKKQKLLKEDLRIIVKKKDKIKKVPYIKPKEIQLVSDDSPYLSEISFVSQWSQFYLLKFKHMAGNRLTLRIKSKKSEDTLLREKRIAMKKLQKNKKSIKKKINKYKTDLLYFSKVAKYTL